MLSTVSSCDGLFHLVPSKESKPSGSLLSSMTLPHHHKKIITIIHGHKFVDLHYTIQQSLLLQVLSGNMSIPELQEEGKRKRAMKTIKECFLRFVKFFTSWSFTIIVANSYITCVYFGGWMSATHM